MWLKCVPMAHHGVEVLEGDNPSHGGKNGTGRPPVLAYLVQQA